MRLMEDLGTIGRTKKNQNGVSRSKIEEICLKNANAK